MCNLDNILKIASKKLCPYKSTTILVWITNDTFFKVHYNYKDSPEYNPFNYRILSFPYSLFQNNFIENKEVKLRYFLFSHVIDIQKTSTFTNIYNCC